jgi:GNAT superfamily N-acetyltransferase
MQLRFSKFTGQDISSQLDGLAALRIAVFRDFPYLYEGSLEYELNYLKVYTASPLAMLFAVYDGQKMVGATTAIPLMDESEEVQQPFLKAAMDIPSILYFGESILLPEFRGLGLGHRFFDEREAHAVENNFVVTTFCAVERPADHPLRPNDYRPNDAFWMKRGYVKQPQLQTTFEWPDIGETISTPKVMTYWMKNL